MVLGLVTPSRGGFRLLGETDINATVLRRVGAMIEAPSLYPFLTARDMLRMAARMSGFREAGREEAVLARVGLTDAADRKARTFSMGMRQRLALGAALLARPELLILDEPTNGLDPAGIQEMRALVRELVDQDGATIILSSHLLDEVEKVCDRVAILNHGKLIAEGRVADLVSGRGAIFVAATPIDKALAIAGPRARAQGDGIRVDIAREEAPALIRALTAGGVDVFEARWANQSLEDVFLSSTAASGAGAS
jgi:ABC-2 type transport system ATP-binding protein